MSIYTIKAESIDYRIECNSLNEVVNKLYVDNQIDNPDLKKAFWKLYENLEISQCERYIDALNISGYYYYTANNLIAAKKDLFKADSLLVGTEYFKEKTQNQLFLGLVYVLEKNYDAAILSFNRCREYARASGDEMKVIDAEMNLGLTYLEKNELEKAENIYKECIQFLEQSNEHDLLLGYAYLNLARLYLNDDKFQKATEFCDKAESTWLKINHVKGLTFSDHLNYKIFEASGQIEKGIPYLLKSLETIEASDFNIKKAEVCFSLGEAYQSINDIESAVQYYKIAMDGGYELPHSKFLETIQFLGNYYFDKGDKNEYANYQKKVQSVLSIKNENEKQEDKKNLVNEETIGTLDKRTTTLVQLNKNIEDEKNKQLRTFGIIGIISLLLLWTIYRIAEYRSKLLDKIQLQYNSLETVNDQLLVSTNEIQEKNRLFEAKNEELQRFAYVASHDLKSPLRTMVSYISLLKSKINNKLEGNQLEYFNFIEESGKSMTALIDDLLSYSNIEQSNLNLIDIESKKMVDQVVEVLSKDITAYNAKVEVDIPSQQLIKVDKIKMQQVFQNLLANSIKHSSTDRSPHINISTKESEGYITFSIKDNGDGIDLEYLDQIFEMFKTFSKNKNAGSSGIGLAICKKVIELHKGEIWVENNDGHGCTFSFTIPS